MGELVDITEILKEKELLRDKELSETQHQEKLSQNGLICFERFNDFLENCQNFRNFTKFLKDF